MRTTLSGAGRTRRRLTRKPHAPSKTSQRSQTDRSCQAHKSANGRPRPAAERLLVQLRPLGFEIETADSVAPLIADPSLEEYFERILEATGVRS